MALAEHVLEAGVVSVQALANHFGVTRMTIYRDVGELETSGVLFLRQGAAVAGSSSFTETTSTFRSTLNRQAKVALCQVVRGFIRPGSTVMLDDSSTVIPLVAMLAEQAPITIITHSQRVAVEAARFPQLRLFVTGGSYRPSFDSYSGETTIRTLRSTTADFCVMSSTAIAGGVLYHPFEENVAVKRAMMEQARITILLADSSKFGHWATHRVASVDDFDHIVLHGQIAPVELDALAECHLLRADDVVG